MIRGLFRWFVVTPAFTPLETVAFSALYGAFLTGQIGVPAFIASLLGAAAVTTVIHEVLS